MARGDGCLFDDVLLSEIRERFVNVDCDPFSGRRIYFENAGGTLRLNQSTTDFEFTDPSLEYEVNGWQLEYATEAFLLTYPENGKNLVPDVATGLPKVSADGKTYTFTLKHNFAFNTGEKVTAQS